MLSHAWVYNVAMLLGESSSQPPDSSMIRITTTAALLVWSWALPPSASCSDTTIDPLLARRGDVERQAPNVFRMRLLGAKVIPVTSGRGTLKDAMNDALRDWVTNVRDTFYCIGTVAGPHPYPAMVRDFQSIIGHFVDSMRLSSPYQRSIQPPCIASNGGKARSNRPVWILLSDPERAQRIGVRPGSEAQ